MARKLVTQLSNRECFTLTEKDTLKTASNKLQTHNVGLMPAYGEDEMLTKEQIDIVSFYVAKSAGK